MRFRRGWMIAAVWLAASWGLAAQAAERIDYRFAPGDVIDVTVTPQKAFDRTVTVQPDGMISYSRIGQLQAAGLTVGQLAELLQTGLNHDLVDPRVPWA